MSGEELIERIAEYLWQQHLVNEQQYAYCILLAPLIGLAAFLAMWYRCRAHVPSLLDAIAFFFAPRGPERMLIFKDLAGNRVLIYDYNIVKGSSGYIVQAGPYLIKCSEDPEAYAEPVSLLDARGPAGIPSPFGLWARQLIAAYFMLALVTISFANTFWTTLTVYMPLYEYATLTSIDLLSFAALTLCVSWFIAVLLRSLAPQTLLITLSAVGMSENYVEASPALDVYSSFPPAKLLKSINKEPKVTISHEVLDKLSEEIGDRTLAASILAMLGQVYNTWRKSLGLLLQDRYDISVAARARYHLEEVKIPRGFLQRYSGILALSAIVFAVVLLILWLQPAIVPVAETPTATATTPTAVVTPAPPPPPPTNVSATSVAPTPAQPPPPPMNVSVGG